MVELEKKEVRENCAATGEALRCRFHKNDYALHWLSGHAGYFLEAAGLAPGRIPRLMKNGLQQLVAHLQRLGLAPTYRGDPYGQGLDWVYFDCFFDEAAVRRQFGLGPKVAYTAYDGRVAGQEAGFYDPGTGFGVMGHHPDCGRASGKLEITGAE